MNPRYLIDTNLLIYPYDASDPAKQSRAEAVLARLGELGLAALPAQALSEFAGIALRKTALGLSAQATYDQVERLEQAFPIIPLTPSVVLEAIRGVREYHLAFFDAQIWSTAKLNQIPVVLSEDFSAGTSLEGVAFVNPLHERFVLAEL